MPATDPQRETPLYDDGRTRIGYRALDPQPVYIAEPVDRPVRRTMIFVHGISEHALRFLPFARQMALRGLRVVLFNLHAHGVGAADAGHAHWLARAYLTQEPEHIIHTIQTRDAGLRRELMRVQRENVRRMARTTMEEHLVQIEEVVRALSRDADPGAPLLLAGHSLGGLIAAEGACRLAQRGPMQPQGLVLLCPALRPAAPPFLGAPARWLVDLSWSSRHNRWLAPIGMAMRAIPAVNIRLRCGWASRYISDIPAHQQLHMADPLILRCITSGYLIRIEALMASVQQRARSFPCDALTFASANDPVISTAGTRTFAQALQTCRDPDRCPLTVYDDFFAHSPVHSSRLDDVLHRMEAWLGLSTEVASSATVKSSASQPMR
jgi:alpha-beta hydrolase superfamily lysophospholipase